MPRPGFLLLCTALAAQSVASAVAGASTPRASRPTAQWKRVASGLEFSIVDTGTRRLEGSAKIAIVRASPRRVRLDIFHESESAGARAADIEAWQKRTGATVIFNAGQYLPGGQHMGLFMKNGRNLGTGLRKAWKGILIASPGVRILDLDYDSFDPAADKHAIAVQSLMLLDREGKKRVRRSEWRANRTVVAEDRRGRLLVLVTEGAWTLWGLADWLARSDLQVHEAMSLDGGFQSQLRVRGGDTEYTMFGQWSIDGRGDHSMPGLRAALPAVIGLFPRK